MLRYEAVIFLSVEETPTVVFLQCPERHTSFSSSFSVRRTCRKRQGRKVQVVYVRTAWQAGSAGRRSETRQHKNVESVLETDANTEVGFFLDIRTWYCHALGTACQSSSSFFGKRDQLHYHPYTLLDQRIPSTNDWRCLVRNHHHRCCCCCHDLCYYQCEIQSTFSSAETNSKWGR